jgi:hypothetical protein
LEYLSGAVSKFRKDRARLRHIDEFKASFIDEIPRMDSRERTIIGYLRHHNQNRFEGRYDGGYASSLLAKGYVLRVSPGQPYDAFRHPFEVNPALWPIIREREADFPHQPIYQDRMKTTERPPWIIPVV